MGVPAGHPWNPGGPRYGALSAPDAAAGRAAPIAEEPGACAARPGGTGGRCGPTIADTGGPPATTWENERDLGRPREDADDGSVSMVPDGGVMTMGQSCGTMSWRHDEGFVGADMA
jgi:hypothetical protein